MLSFDDLIGRLEVPNAAVKWDKPLFTVDETADLPAADVCEALFNGSQHRACLATTPQVLGDTNFLYELDRITQDVEKAIVASQPMVGLGGVMALPHATEKVL